MLKYILVYVKNTNLCSYLTENTRLLYNQKNVLNIWSEHIYILSHRLVHTTTCFGPVYWPSSGCTINLTSSCTICAWGTLGGRDLVLQ